MASNLLRGSHGHLFEDDDVEQYHKAQQQRATIGVKRRALLVDDVVVTTRLTRASLHRTGFLCDSARDGEEAVKMAKLHQYYVILMDVQLPKKDGVQATTDIREFEEKDQNRTPSIIFGMTGSCSDNDLDRYDRAGMDGCIEKGCVVARALHEAIAMHHENPKEFVFINLRNVQVSRKKHERPNLILPKTPTSASTSSNDLRLNAISTDNPYEESIEDKNSPVVVRKKQNLSQCKRVLLVDDVRVTQKVTQAALRRTGYECVMASDGQAALDMAKEIPFEVILMDVQLPVLDGVKSTELIRQFERTTNRKPAIILGLTGSCKLEDLKRYSDAGMDGCIEKGCVVSRAMHEALAAYYADQTKFVFIDSRNMNSHPMNKDETQLAI